MGKSSKKDCCKGCQNGKPGGNPPCKTRSIVAYVDKARKEKELELKTEDHEN